MSSEDLVAQCLHALDAIGANYMVVGSFSSNYYGIPRSTQDADIVVEVLGDEITQLRERLRGTLRLEDQMAFETVRGATKHVFQAEGAAFVIEVFELSSDPFAQERFRRRIAAQVGGVPAFLPTAEDVIVQKLLWQRGKDLDDVRDVISVQHPNLDWLYILKWVREHGSEEALEAVCEELGITPGE